MELLRISNSLPVSIVSGDKIRHQEIATKLEVAFISEMLSFVEMKGVTTEFGGGVGEDHFQSFLREQHAKLIVDQGGLGLAEQFVTSISKA